MKITIYKTLIIGLLPLIIITCTKLRDTRSQQSETIRFASYNVALFRSEQGQLAKDLQSGTDPQIKNVAAVIQHVRPDVLGLFEFDYDPTGQLLKEFQNNYLNVDQHGENAITYPYLIQIPSNTGIPSDVDYNRDGKVELPNDAFGFGKYEGQYAFALLSKFPLDLKQIRSYQNLLWSEMPNARQPMQTDGTPYYSKEAWATFRLSSKNHIDIPIKLPNGKTIHTILAHPTPPVFDGPEDRNGLRNYDEIRLLKDYISNASYLVDDNNKKGGLKPDQRFVIMGDLNADPVDGDSPIGTIDQLLQSPLVNPLPTTGSWIPKSNGGKVHHQKKGDKGDPAYDTSFFGKRIDYVIPSKNMEVVGSGVFWPVEGEALYELVKEKRASDHLLVWVDAY